MVRPSSILAPRYIVYLYVALNPKKDEIVVKVSSLSAFLVSTIAFFSVSLNLNIFINALSTCNLTSGSLHTRYWKTICFMYCILEFWRWLPPEVLLSAEDATLSEEDTLAPKMLDPPRKMIPRCLNSSSSESLCSCIAKNRFRNSCIENDRYEWYDRYVWYDWCD